MTTTTCECGHDQDQHNSPEGYCQANDWDDDEWPCCGCEQYDQEHPDWNQTRDHTYNGDDDD